MISDLQVWQAEMGLLFLAIVIPVYVAACTAVLLIQQWRRDRAQGREDQQDERNGTGEGGPSAEV